MQKAIFWNALLQVCSGECTQRLYSKPKVTKKAKFCLFYGKFPSLLEAPIIKEARADILFPQQTAHVGKRPSG